LKQSGDLNAGPTGGKSGGTDDDGGFAVREDDGDIWNLRVGSELEFPGAEIADEIPGVFGGAALAGAPLEFADNGLEEFLDFEGLAFDLEAGGRNFERGRRLRFPGGFGSRSEDGVCRAIAEVRGRWWRCRLPREGGGSADREEAEDQGGAEVSE